MDVLFVTNRSVLPQGLADTAIPGPVKWGIATATPAKTAPEGFTWAFDNGKGQKELEEPAFLQQLSKALAPGKKPKALLVHLHGAGCMSADMVCRGANLATLYGGPDLEIVPLMVSWACGSFNPDEYLAARRWLQRDVAGLAAAFRTIATAAREADLASPGSLRTVLSAHSLGNYLLGRILADCAARNDEPGADAPFDDVLLLASDVDDNALDERNVPPGLALHRLGKWVRGIHVYYSSRDGVVGLGWLGQLAMAIPGRSGPALGSNGPMPSIAQLPDGTPVDAVNCCFLPGAVDGNTQHHYWRIDPLAVRDVSAVIRGTAPSHMPWRSRNLLDRSWNLFASEPAIPTG